MAIRDLISQIKQLPVKERLELMEALTRSLRDEFDAAGSEFAAHRTDRLELVRSAVRPPTISGKELVRFPTSMPPEAGQEMAQAIEEACERINTHEW